MLMRFILALTLTIVSSIGATTAARGADHTAISPLIADDVAAVAFLDLQKIDVAAIVDFAASLGAPDPKEDAEAPQFIATAQGQLDALRKLGARRVYVLLRASDVTAGGTSLVVEVAEPGQTAAVLNAIKLLLDQIGGLDAIGKPQVLAVRDNLVLGAVNDQRMKLLMESHTEKTRSEALAALDGLGDAGVGVAVFGDADSRRVVREMFPQLPAPFAEIDGRLLADGLHWGGLALTFPPKPTITFALEASTNDIAASLEQLFEHARDMAGAALLADSVSGPPAHQQRAATLLPLLPKLNLTQNDSRLTITFGDDPHEIEFLRNLGPALTQGVRDDAYRSQRMNQFKQLALGMLNYESAKRSFPTAASYDAEGRPLLSWRVLILPFMEQNSLYDQFKLDEPWDSEHNRKLIEQMPEIYADPDPAVRKVVGPGKTTYVVPTSEGLIFGSKEAKTFRYVNDGTSNTILAVEVVPEQAVVWTKPDDWKVDMKDPLAGVKRSDREWFTTVWCDGHVSILTKAISPDVFKATLTPAGGEVLDQAEIK